MTSPDPGPDSRAYAQPNQVAALPRVILITALAFLAILLASPASTTTARAGRAPPDGALPGYAPQEVTRDVAVTSIARAEHKPPFAHQGEEVTINVGVANQGNAAETFLVTLHDPTDAVEIGQQTVTLAAGSSQIIAFLWNTAGATGGPPPPGPPAPGSIHSLTATATLAGDSDSGNDSMTFMPGFWIIAVAQPPGITIGDAIPQARYGEDLSLNLPSAGTKPVEATGLFLSPVAGRLDATLTSPDIGTRSAGLNNLFLSPVPGRLDGALENPGIDTQARPLARILLDPAETHLARRLAGPGIDTAAEPLSRVLPSWVEAPQAAYGIHRSPAAPSVDTGAAPLTHIFLKPGPVKASGELANPAITTGIEPSTQILIDRLQIPQARYDAGRPLAGPSIGTRPEALTQTFVSPASPREIRSMEPATIETRGEPREEIFVGSTAASFQPGRSLQDPFTRGEIAGKVNLQQRDSSLGAYLQVADEIHFVAADGTFRVEAPSGVMDIYIRAPGYLSVFIPGATINSGELLTVPELTLPFGDANGDGRIDILDLSIAAGNFGAANRQLPAP